MVTLWWRQLQFLIKTFFLLFLFHIIFSNSDFYFIFFSTVDESVSLDRKERNSNEDKMYMYFLETVMCKLDQRIPYVQLKFFIQLSYRENWIKIALLLHKNNYGIAGFLWRCLHFVQKSNESFYGQTLFTINSIFIEGIVGLFLLFFFFFFFFLTFIENLWILCRTKFTFSCSFFHTDIQLE